jgi:hypothetical protein
VPVQFAGRRANLRTVAQADTFIHLRQRSNRLGCCAN